MSTAHHVCHHRGWLAACVTVFLAGCAPDRPGDYGTEFTFVVLDVGQGLSQVAFTDSAAVVWDMGPPEAYAAWRSSWQTLGSRRLSAIVISHAQMDHMGGLQLLDSAMDFSGVVIVSPHEDTAFIRAHAGFWRDRIRMAVMAQGDTIGLIGGVHAACLWPPAANVVPADLQGDTANQYSFCFKLTYANTAALITSDIDTVAEQQLAAVYRWGLKSDILVAPHHGSAGSVGSSFFGYVDPAWTVISCAAVNPYGHPSERLYNMLYQMRSTALTTFERGNVIARSNGEYWQF
jgi:competence protein ComEC